MVKIEGNIQVKKILMNKFKMNLQLTLDMVSRMLFFNTAIRSRSIKQSRTVRFQSTTTTTEESLNIARVAIDDDTFNTGAFSSKAQHPEP